MMAGDLIPEVSDDPLLAGAQRLHEKYYIARENNQSAEKFACRDGTRLNYKMDGNCSESAPVIVFINEILVRLEIWDAFVVHLSKLLPDHKMLRYG
jgi:hypothetical protein